MASDDPFTDELTSEFVTETREMLSHVSDALLAWESQPDDRAQIDAIFRFVHTVKGSCGFLDLPRIAALAHAAESQLARVREGGRVADAGLVSTMLAVIDRIGALVDALEDPGAAVPPEATDHALFAALEGEPTTPATETFPPEPDGATGAPALRSVRVALPLLEALMTQVSDLVLIRNELSRAVRLAQQPFLDSGFERLSAIVTDLRDSVTRTRMQPIDRLFATLPRLVRDTAKACGKVVHLELSGQDVEIDREMVEAIRDPLIHIVRNAIDHGVELPDDRVRAGKPATSRLHVAALQSGNQVSIEITDDGRGIDTVKLVQRALGAGVIDSAKASQLDANAMAQLIFEPGLSTAETVSTISGRGVGMDVVRANVERLGGLVTLVNRPGAGLTVTLRAPLTLSIVNALVVRASGQCFAVPRGAVEEVIALDRGHARLEPLGGGLVGVVRDTTLPAFRLADIMGDDRSQRPSLAMTLKTARGARFVLAVDAVDGQEELVVRPMAPQLAGNGLFAGQSLGDDGRPVLVLDPVGLASSLALATPTRAAAEEALDKPLETVVLGTTFDGRTVAVRTMLVERLVETSRADWVISGGQLFCIFEGRHLNGACPGELPPDGCICAILLNDGQRQAVVAIKTVRDLATPAEYTEVDAPGVESIALVDGESVEVLDVLPLLAQSRTDHRQARTVKIELAQTPWSRGVLMPLLAGAGYAIVDDPDAEVDLVVRLDSAPAVATPAAHVIALAGNGRGDVATDQYDRATLRDLIRTGGARAA